jgi:methylmalonyl-CoA mutase cobalamin-binding domain/chain
MVAGSIPAGRAFLSSPDAPTEVDGVDVMGSNVVRAVVGCHRGADEGVVEAAALLTDVLGNADLSLAGERIVLAGMDVHDLARDVLRAALVQLGAEVVLLPADSLPDTVASAAVAEDAATVIVSTYNGTALTHGRNLMAVLTARDYDGAVIMGGILNEDRGDDLPIDVTDQLKTLGILCPARLNDLAPLIAQHSPRAHR